MSSEISIIAGTAATIGLIHTVLGPDHYLPFMVMARARKWSMRKTLLITFLCGVGHILSSVILGLGGIVLGIAVFKLEKIESFRGGLAAWLLMAFGLVYFIWGLRRAFRMKPHVHEHAHEDGSVHHHRHTHVAGHSHLHTGKSENITPWILFTVFVFGPCEPLIPLIMYPAARHNMGAVLLVSVIFGITTISTMLILVAAAYLGLAKLPLKQLERHSHSLAGLVIFLCGGAMVFLGL